MSDNELTPENTPVPDLAEQTLARVAMQQVQVLTKKTNADREVQRKLKRTQKWLKLFGSIVITLVGLLIYPVSVSYDHALTHPFANSLIAQQKNLRQYVDNKVQHECQALVLLSKTPVPKPKNPKANPSREATYEFYIDLKMWATKDGCFSHPIIGK